MSCRTVLHDGCGCSVTTRRTRREIDEHTLIRLAKQQNSSLLTRDDGITQSKACGECIHIASEKIESQLQEVACALKKQLLIRLPQRLRCSLCNGTVMLKERKTLMDELPEHVVLHQTAFFHCHVCGKVYWNGSHSRAISSARSAFREELRSCCVICKSSC
ncbi:MAG: hypothetical protein FD164_859 [Nitrospirae bacterium]|nr:MAG: hypothetical protein FD164_859 [Nitrospirota bacterium]